MTNTMLQQVINAPKDVVINTVPVPVPNAGQVLVKIMRVGICGSDMHVFHGLHPYTSYPVTQGHEVSGQIVALGEGTSGLSVGQKVTIEPQVYCGTCYPCTHGKYNLCESLKVMGFQTDGTACEYFAVDASKVTPLPDDMSYDEGAMIEPLAVAVHAVKRMGDVTGMNVCVLGCGPIGILLIQALKAFGAAKIMATDISDHRLDLAKKCGASEVYNTKNVDFGQAMLDTFGPDKADVIFDCAGNDITMDQAIQNARKGSTIILVAVYANLAKCDLAKLNDSELDLNTTMMYRHEDYVDAIRFVADKLVDLKPLMSKHFSFVDYQKAYEYIDANQETIMKVLIDVGTDEESEGT